VEKVVSGGRIPINLNGETGEYFRTYKGLRQGDPLSPLLLNFVGDALAAILQKVKESGVITGMIPELGEGDLTHLYSMRMTQSCLLIILPRIW